MNASKEEIARRYSYALFSAAEQLGVLEVVSKDLELLTEFISANRSKLRMALSETVSSRVKAVFLNSALAVLDLHQVTLNFIRLMLFHNRLHSIMSTIDAFHGLMRERNGELIVNVKSVVPLEQMKLEAMREEFESIFGMRVVINYSIDTEVLGGMVVVVGSHMFDATLRTKLRNLRKLALQI
ncbi:ATP synthase F1 subunit delta [Rickettsiales endosymbiont of Peranema trichophorum]|uniref:ATP synthase F1 subunit delta n=1 Tax=Rickettsiales endosymbiont of Peranema trichophorum TaxID=2486577 RepID=UPI001022F285|nr:ATP synthase F1 subunit delta [Rickettsiales endosymbiont of Peranema trichophorum]RZI45548.1 ATP synthase F1 subunit delta [Rickettsiales endosymbiont of Peranema trichophorum]